MPKLLCNFIEIALQHGCSPVSMLHIFRTSFSENTSGGLILLILKKTTFEKYLYSGEKNLKGQR